MTCPTCGHRTRIATASWICCGSPAATAGSATRNSTAFDRHGRLLATEYSTAGLLAPPTTPGALVRISRNGHTVTSLPVTGLFQPTGLAIGSHGAVYVSNFGDSTATAAHPGQILRITGLS
jgi:hypothetical protein